MIGVVGHSGAGKTTLVNLLCRFYDVTNGAIRIDGVDVRDLSMEDIRKQIGMVLQTPFLFRGTLSENIAYGKPDASREEIIRAAKAATPTISSPACRRLRHHRGRGRFGPFRRRDAARLDCPRHPERPAHPDPRRGHFVGGYRD
jgi:ABC-type Fe3+/spermidine/putrescine transport system ATPase subunit